MMTRETLLVEIDRFLEASAMASSTFGRLAVNDGKLVARLRDGGSVSLETAEKIVTFIKSAPAPADGAAA